jgi:dihydrodipicolinate synthase/N-acetylneuraminate lyase
MHLVESIAYRGEKPWHGLGNHLEAGQPIEVWKERAGMDWAIEDSDVRYVVGQQNVGVIRAFPGQKVLYRSDTKAPLAVVSKRFQVVQPGEILEFYRSVSTATDLPFMAYNWPRGVAVDLSADPDLLVRIADLPSVVAVKDSTGDWLRMLTSVEQLSAQVRVFGSFLHRRGLAVLLGLGGDGNIDGGGVGAPWGVPFYRAVRAGDAQAAQIYADRYQALSGRLIAPDYSGRFASPIPQLKAVMTLLGQPGGQVRSPLLPVTDQTTLRSLTDVIDHSGVRDAWAAVGAGGTASPAHRSAQ